MFRCWQLILLVFVVLGFSQHSFSQEGDSVTAEAALTEAIDSYWQDKKREFLGGDYDLTLGARIRYRAEYKQPWSYSLSNGSTSEDRNLLRTRVHMRLGVSKKLSGFIQLQDSREFGSTGSLAGDESGVDLHQGYIEIRDAHEFVGVQETDSFEWTFRMGRQAMPELGDQRMFSPLDWSNIGRSFDGFHSAMTVGDNTLHLIHAQLFEDSGVTGSGKDDTLTVVYFSSTPLENTEFDLYGAWRNYKNDGVTGEDGSTGDLEDQTYGIRAEHRINGWRFSGEVVKQLGSSARDDVNAEAWAVEAGFRAKDMKYKPGITVGWTFASGDGDPTDGDEETFNPIAPFGHAYQGHMDNFSWRNGNDYFVKGVATILDGVNVHADLHFFRLDKAEDSWYNAGGNAIRTDASGNSGRDIGQELDLYAKWSFDKNLKFWAGWTHFWQGNYVSKSGGGAGQGDFLFFQCELFFGKN